MQTLHVHCANHANQHSLLVIPVPRCSGAQSTDYAATIRRAFQHDGLQGAVDALPLERRFKLSNVKDVSPSTHSCSSQPQNPSTRSLPEP